MPLFPRWLRGLLACTLSAPAVIASTSASTAIPPPPIRLWEGNVPEARGAGEGDVPTITHLPAPTESATGCAVIVCPGGGYWVRAMDHEGLQVARWLNRHGIDAYLLSYRVRTDGYQPPVALLDATRAIRLVRSRAADDGIDPRRIGMLGFSAGCHLVSWVAESATAGDAASPDPVERASSRPDFLIMVYGPAASQSGEGWPPVREVAADHPPAFILLTHTDFVDPAPAMRLVLALRARSIDAELHLFGGDGRHGRGLHTGDPDTGRWPGLALGWLRRGNFLCGRDRLEVSGTVTIDGTPPFMGWITLLPASDPNLPPASVHISDADRKNPANGRFSFAPGHGPVAGRYRVVVRHQATDFTKQPSLPDERVYDRLAPDDPAPLEVDLRPGSTTLDLAFRSR